MSKRKRPALAIPVRQHHLKDIVEQGGQRQCFLLRRNIGRFTRKLIYFQYLKKIIIWIKVSKNITFNFENRRTGERAGCMIQLHHE